MAEPAKTRQLPGIILIILVTALVIAAFVIGSLYTKVKYLEKGSALSGSAPAQGPANAKYKSFSDAMKAFAKQAGANDKKLVECMDKGEKKGEVDASVADGEKYGVSGTPSFFINGRFLGGAFPFEAFKEIIDKELDGKGSDDAAEYSQSLQEASKAGAFKPKKQQIPAGDAPNKGPENAPVMIVEYSDFQCQYCQRGYQTMKQVLSTYGEKIRFVYKHFPLISIHSHAQKTAEAAACAADQGKFWQFHDALFDSQSDWTSLP
ncbi:thioredoxin domain-containing protein [Patescibacteria group bacterium]|nr:thioredoxin domain-containing protein [Patescibacteria group bacterium]MBU1472714.1 thioredoxin domain-containing protein [Patescibacteria group bacterium]MBU2459981.1 thioredoxin domain-containing protein [Patescibacteria group bacterium]MBU2544361.1 thioredoxin domain-containing protein [Patescibacteria group bacterium]